MILEDWTTEREFAETCSITGYPSFIDGAKLYVVRLTGGIKVKVVTKSDDNVYSHVDSLGIQDSSVWTLQKLYLVRSKLCNRAGDGWLFGYSSSNKRVYLYISEPQSTPKSFAPSDNPVSSKSWITDDCTLTLDKA